MSAAASQASQSSQRKVTFQNAASEEPASRDKSKKDIRTVILIVPFGVPGSGKSTIWKTLKAHLETLDAKDWTFDVVSSDSIRAQQMQSFIA